MFRGYFTKALTLAVIGSLLMSTPVFADNTRADGDGVAPFTNNPNVAFGNVCVNTATSKPVLVLKLIARAGVIKYSRTAQSSVSV